ncbi:ABC transporter permease [Sneathiella litorea]|uniref:ABC transporter permease n=1 Tax=Sneathiella litorea TaxID=2606216 RepID=A0A6L8W634_9PROT|nr:ABC transporter permease [Sneathiella litorea]MZR29840.1 ABC transporter permease [Sneathiella litorea]
MNRTVLLLATPAIAVIGLLCLAPLVLVVVWSFWTWDPSTYWIKPDLSFAAYEAIFEAGRWKVLLDSIIKALLTGLICLVIGYPAAYCIHFLAGNRSAFLLMGLFTIPFFTSYLIRSFSWRLVLGRNGMVNSTLMSTGLIDEPIEWLLFSDFAVIVGLVASYLPFVIFPLLLSMRKVEKSVLQASLDLGASFFQTLRTVLLPLTKAGCFAGFLFVFVMSLGSSTEVKMLGGAAASMISVMINDVMRVVNFPLAFAISSVVILFLLILLYVGNRHLKLAKLFEDFSW